jgi:hypothetical protein
MKGRRRHDAHRITTNYTTHRTDARKAADHRRATPRTTPPRLTHHLLLVSRVQRTHHSQQRTPVPVLRRTHHAARAACSMTQHMDALAKGNTVRLERARIKRKLKDMTRADAWDQAAEYISEPPAALKGVLVHDFLQWQHRYGASPGERPCRCDSTSHPASPMPGACAAVGEADRRDDDRPVRQDPRARRRAPSAPNGTPANSPSSSSPTP